MKKYRWKKKIGIIGGLMWRNFKYRGEIQNTGVKFL